LRIAELLARVRLTIVRFTLIAVMTGPIKQKRAASGYELLKGDDDLETREPKRDGSVEELKCSRVQGLERSL